MPVKPNTTKDKFGDDLMIKAETTPQGETEGYPSAVTVTGNTRLVQTDTSGRTWRVMGEDGTS